MRLHLILLFTAAFILASCSSWGPNVFMPAAYGEVSLRAGFTPDPYEVALTAGGNDFVEIDGCTSVGAINRSRPDFILNWSGDTSELKIYAVSRSANTGVTLLVNDPMTNWNCATRGMEVRSDVGDNPMLTFRSPTAGIYTIWVGRAGNTGGRADATLGITELDQRRFYR